jgi:hypothetical protein
MSKQKNEPELEGINVRVTPYHWHVLHVYMAITKKRSLQEVLRPVVESYAERVARRPQMEQALTAGDELASIEGQESSANRRGQLSRLDAPSRQRRSGRSRRS